MDIEKVKDGLKSIITMENWSCGTIDKNKEQAIGVYDNTRRIEKISQFDNLQTYTIVPFSLLIRYTQNYVSANKKAYEIYNAIKNKKILEIDNKEYYMILVDENPQNTGPDDKGIYEFVIDFNLLGGKQNGR